MTVAIFIAWLKNSRNSYESMRCCWLRGIDYSPIYFKNGIDNK